MAGAGLPHNPTCIVRCSLECNCFQAALDSGSEVPLTAFIVSGAPVVTLLDAKALTGTSGYEGQAFSLTSYAGSVGAGDQKSSPSTP